MTYDADAPAKPNEIGEGRGGGPAGAASGNAPNPIIPSDATPSGQSAPPRQAAEDMNLTQAAESLAHILRASPTSRGEDSATAALVELHKALEADGDNESLLFLHARMLDAMFNRLIFRAFPADNTVSDEGLRLALRAEAQCRTTVEALSKLRARQHRILENELKTTRNVRDSRYY